MLRNAQTCSGVTVHSICLLCEFSVDKRISADLLLFGRVSDYFVYNNMYRNTYLELYKSSASHEKNPTILLTHFSQIYNTLGCVLQDLQYHIGRLQLQNAMILPETSPKLPEPPSMPKITNTRKPEREIVKIEDSADDLILKKGRISDKQQKQVQPNSKKTIVGEEGVKQEQADPQPIINKTALPADRMPRQQQSGSIKVPPLVPAVRVQPPPSNSFDDLFGEAPRQKLDNDQNRPAGSQRKQQNELDVIPESQGNNTLDDFMDRLFKKDGARKSR